MGALTLWLELDSWEQEKLSTFWYFKDQNVGDNYKRFLWGRLSDEAKVCGDWCVADGVDVNSLQGYFGPQEDIPF